MPLDDLQRQVAAAVLREAKRYGFALAGGCALIAHGVVDRSTEDVDLFTDDETGVEAAAAAVEASLRAAGFQVEREDKTAGLAEVFPGMGEGLAEWDRHRPRWRGRAAADRILRPQARTCRHRPRASP